MRVFGIDAFGRSVHVPKRFKEFSVSSLLYKDHTIRAWATRDEITGEYAPTVQIAWETIDGRRETHSFTLPKRCSTFYEAHSIAIEEAMAWADRRLIHVGP
jgi:hypothetical protein